MISQKINIVSNYVREINIAKMIVEDSLLISEKIDLEEDIKELRKKSEEEKTIEELHKITVVNLKKICKKMGLKRYSKLRKHELIKFISENQQYITKFEELKQKYFHTYYWKERAEIVETIKILLDIISHSRIKEERINNAINIFEYINKNLMFLIMNPKFHKTVIIKIKDFEQDDTIKNNKKFKESVLNIKNF